MFLGEATRVIENLTYTDEVTDGEQTFLFWNGIVDDREISGVTVVADEAAGLIGDLTVLLRSWGVVANFRDTMLRALADAVPLTPWQLDDGKTPVADPMPESASVQAGRSPSRQTSPSAAPC